jgi:choline-glycine betaine transporter
LPFAIVLLAICYGLIKMLQEAASTAHTKTTG